MPTDAGTVTSTVDASALEQLVDTGTVTVTLVLSGLQAYYVTVNNPGTRNAWPTIEVEGEVSNLLLKNVTTGKTLQWFDFLLDSGDSLTVDHRVKQVRKSVGGVTPAFEAGAYPDRAEFWKLIPGNNVIMVGGSSLLGSITLNVTFRYD